MNSNNRRPRPVRRLGDEKRETAQAEPAQVKKDTRDIARKAVEKPKKHVSKWTVLLRIFIVAVVFAVLILLILYLTGFRYMSYKVTRGDDVTVIKFIGRVDMDGNPSSGTIFYPDKTARVSAADGTISYSNGDVYSGPIKKMLKHGAGIIIFAGGDKYEGQFDNDIISGYGRYTYANEDWYEGYFLDGYRSGVGVMNWASGAKYEGGFLNNLRSGEGVMTYADGTVYQGNYVDDLRNGKGTVTFSNGDSYVGDFVNDKRTGTGTYTWANGEMYMGEFKDDVIEGQGTYTWPSGRTYTGTFKNGKIILDEGVMRDSDGTELVTDDEAKAAAGVITPLEP